MDESNIGDICHEKLGLLGKKHWLQKKITKCLMKRMILNISLNKLINEIMRMCKNG